MGAELLFSTGALTKKRFDRWRDSQERRTHVSGMAVSALIALGALVIGLLIIHFTPDERRK
jgi:hypothetical protein